MEDLVEYARESGVISKDESDIVGIDIGTGPSCIYPLLSTSMHKQWKFVATDVDPFSCKVAKENVQRNNLSERIQVLHNPIHKHVITPALESDLKARYTFVMTNPPFYDGQTDLDECRQLKSNPPPEILEYTDSEYFFEGGEAAFVKIMFEESLKYRDRVIWYTSIVAKKSNLKPLRNLIKGHEDVKTYHWTRFIQGATSRWAIAWSFHRIEVKPEHKLEKHKKKKTKLENVHLSISLSHTEIDSTLASVLDEMKQSAIEIERLDEVNFIFHVTANTWCRKSRRGHAPPPSRFDMSVAREGATLRFYLPEIFKDREEDFVSLVSHIQKKWNLTKPKP